MAHQSFAPATAGLRSAVRMMERSLLRDLHLRLLLAKAKRHPLAALVPLALAKANLEIAMRMLVLTAD